MDPPTDSRSNTRTDTVRAREELQNLTQSLKRHVSQLTILYKMGRDISENENWSDALDRFLMALVNYLRADGAALLLFSENERRLAPRSSFQVDDASLKAACITLLDGWKGHPRGLEIHSIESYQDKVFDSCLERTTPWCSTLIPLKHRNRSLGFLLIDKKYRRNQAFRNDYHFLNTLQTIFAGEVANASYISELRQLSRFNQKVLDNINSGVITTDTAGGVCFSNRRARSLCPQLGSLQNISFDDLFTSKTFGKDFFRKIIRSKKDSFILEIKCKRGRNTFFPARLSTTKMHDDNLNGSVIVGIFEDLTDQKRMEAEIRKNDRLRALGQLSAGVAHEIRNPLTGIATSIEVLGSKLREEPDKVKYIHAVLDEISRLDGIIRNLLNFAKPAKPRITTCSLPEIAGRVIRLLADQATNKGVELVLEDKVDEDTCSADGDQITQVLMNLVLNAIQACTEGDRIEMILRNKPESGRDGRRYRRVDVIDSGPGIPKEIRRNLFDPFFTTKSQGTGLGLAISQQIVEEHGGKILNEFRPGETVFSVLLPAVPADRVIIGEPKPAKGS
jgi:two-component system NtrC family sensor kinase